MLIYVGPGDRLDLVFIMTTIIWKTNNQMKADVKLNKLAKLQLHILNVRQTTPLTVRHYANVMLWLNNQLCIFILPEFVLNPAGKSDICILHEYVQQAMRIQPRYVFEELQNTNTPFGATVIISGEKYGSGYSSSKKGAKLEAGKCLWLMITFFTVN